MSSNSNIKNETRDHFLESMSLTTQNCDNNKNNISQLINITVGSRKSKLALIQTESVIKQLTDFYGNQKLNFVIKTMSTTGDNILNIPLSKIGEKALFTRELEEELIDNKIDFIVHSLKDLPTSLPNGCCIAAITKREDPSDALVLKEGLKLENPIDILSSCGERSDSVTIGTSSLRRIAQLKHLNPNIKIADIRGNLNTRISKLDDESTSYSALILASAGLKRADYSSRISKRLLDDWYYAVGQGALAIECRTNDKTITDLLRPIIDMKTTFECLAERTLMQQLEGGCSVPIGVKCSWSQDNNSDDSKDLALLTLDGIVLSLDGLQKVQNKLTLDLNQKPTTDIDNPSINYTGIATDSINDEVSMNKFKNSAILGYRLAQSLLELGAKQILSSIKKT